MKVKFLPYLLLIIAPLLWGGNFLTGRLMHGEIPPFTFSFYRWILVTLFLLPFVWKEFIAKWPSIRSHLGLYAVLAFTGVSCYTSFVYWSLNYTSVVNASLINAMVPAMILLISWGCFGNRISWKQIIGITISLIGVLFIVLQGQFRKVLTLGLDRGEIIMMVAVVAWAFYSILLKRLAKEKTPFLTLFINSLIGVIFLIVPFLYEFFSNEYMHVTLQSTAGLLYTALFASIVSYSCWNTGIRELGAEHGGHFYNLLPVFGAILGVLFLGESFRWFHWVGILLVFFGIFFATGLGKRRIHQNKPQR